MNATWYSLERPTLQQLSAVYPGVKAAWSVVPPGENRFLFKLPSGTLMVRVMPEVFVHAHLMQGRALTLMVRVMPEVFVHAHLMQGRAFAQRVGEGRLPEAQAQALDAYLMSVVHVTSLNGEGVDAATFEQAFAALRGTVPGVPSAGAEPKPQEASPSHRSRADSQAAGHLPVASLLHPLLP